MIEKDVKENLKMDWEILNKKIQRPVFPKASISNVTFSLPIYPAYI